MSSRHLSEPSGEGLIPQEAHPLDGKPGGSPRVRFSRETIRLQKAVQAINPAKDPEGWQAAFEVYCAHLGRDLDRMR